MWNIEDYTSSSEITIQDSDPLINIANLSITMEVNDYGDNIITFRTLTYKTAEGGTASSLKLVEKLPAEGEEIDAKTKTVMLIYDEGTVNQDATEAAWRSFYIPKEAGITKLVFQFKSSQKPNGVFSVKDDEGKVIENAYYTELSYSTGTESTTTE